MIRAYTVRRVALIAGIASVLVGLALPCTARAQQRTAPNSSRNRAPARIPPVLLSLREQSLCKVKVGRKLPEIALPKVDGGETAKLAEFFGKKATVVVFWKGDRRMARELLADLGPDVIEPFGKQGVNVVGIAVNESPDTAIQLLAKTNAKFTNLIDADGTAFQQVGRDNLPRTFVLDTSGKIVWFDIAYSLATRRELNSTLRALTESK